MNISDQIESHALYKHHENIRLVCSPLRMLDIDEFIFMRHFSDGSFIDLSTNLTWSKFFLTRYLAETYDLITIQDHMFIQSGVSLWQMNHDNLIWQEGKKYFGYDNGISIAINKDQYTDIFCYYKKKSTKFSDQEKIDFYLLRLDVLYKFNQHFLEKTWQIINDAETQKLITPKKYQLKKNLNEKKKKNANNFPDFLNQLHKNQHMALTLKEKQCLELYTLGYTAKQIANKLYLSPRTIESRIETIKQKLDCRNICQLISQYCYYYS